MSPNFSAQFFRAILLGLARPDFSGWNSGQPDSPLACGPGIFISPKTPGLENFQPDPALVRKGWYSMVKIHKFNVICGLSMLKEAKRIIVVVLRQVHVFVVSVKTLSCNNTRLWLVQVHHLFLKIGTSVLWNTDILKTL